MRRNWFSNWYPVFLSIGGTLINIFFALNDVLAWIPDVNGYWIIIIGTVLMFGSIIIYAIRYHAEFNNRVPRVSIVNSGVEKKKLDTFNGLVKHREYFAFIEFSNNPKHKSDEAVAKDVFAELYFFMIEGDKIVPIYDRFEGLWYPYKFTKNVTDKQEKENGSVDLLSSGRREKLMVAQKYVGQDMAMVIENKREYFEHYPHGGNTDYYQEHFLLHDYGHFVLIKLHGTRLDERYVYRLWVDDNEELFFKQEQDKKLCRKIISMKK